MATSISQYSRCFFYNKNHSKCYITPNASSDKEKKINQENNNTNTHNNNVCNFLIKIQYISWFYIFFKLKFNFRFRRQNEKIHKKKVQKYDFIFIDKVQNRKLNLYAKIHIIYKKKKKRNILIMSSTHVKLKLEFRSIYIFRIVKILLYIWNGAQNKWYSVFMPNCTGNCLAVLGKSFDNFKEK
jgi:hypothetical protein